jgi:hypothetical protein
MSEPAAQTHGHGAAQRAIDDFHNLLPLFEEAGYKLESFALDLGVTPKLEPRFVKVCDVLPERRQELLREHLHHRMAHAVLKCLFHANDAQEKLRVGNLSPRGMEITVGIIPKVRLIWS